MRVVLVRHCTTSWNRQGRIQGHTDIPLDAGGRDEALVLGEKLLSLGIQYIFTSDLVRSVHTGRLINQRLRVPWRSDSRIRECSFGSLEGGTREELVEKHGNTIKTIFDEDVADYDFGPYGGESRKSVVDRHLSFLDVLKFMNMINPLVVGHGRGLNSLLRELGHTPNLKRNEWRVLEL